MWGVALEDGWHHDTDEEGEAVDTEKLAEDDPRRIHDDGGVSAEGIDLEMHCCYDSPMYIAGYEGSRTRANRGYPQSLTLPAGEYDAEALLAYCEKWNLPIDKTVNEGKPGWLLFSMWG